jgi:hypothetical protein
MYSPPSFQLKEYFSFQKKTSRGYRVKSLTLETPNKSDYDVDRICLYSALCLTFEICVFSAKKYPCQIRSVHFKFNKRVVGQSE